MKTIFIILFIVIFAGSCDKESDNSNTNPPPPPPTETLETETFTFLLNGIDILKEIKKCNKALPAIMLSSQKSYAIATQTIMYGAVHYVIKGQDAFNEIYELIMANV